MSVLIRTYELLLDAGKQLQKLPKLLLSFPKIVLSLLKRVASTVAILPLDTFSGKMLFLTLSLFVVTAGSWLLYTIDGIDAAWTAAMYAGGATTVSALVFAVSYPLDRAGLIEGLLVRFGIRQRMRISTRYGALAGGVLVAVVSTVLAEVVFWRFVGSGFGLIAMGTHRELLWPEWQLGAIFLVTVLGATAVLLGVSRRKTRSLLSEDISVLEVIGNDEREVVLRNDAESAISIVDAKITDATGANYALNADIRFRPGEKRSVKLPDGFVLESESDDTSIEGFYQRHVTSIYSRTGETYVVQWEG
ncbi:hypothetical protein [Natrarchaeobius halalkaliphilus]|uniref:hypothetical protein n=1 Tax=Natrarchaeobius halalkaliphilus TaxID=1679091 RepID=UPI001404549A|nr:hypothetical protein [Natrarchaeobius halalkaliphilus]